MALWVLHPKLASDTAFVSDWPLSRVLLMNDSRFPWLILVPRRAGLHELHDLAAAHRALLIEEIAAASQALVRGFAADKINVAALGNQVPQLHVHVIARHKSDAAQPNTVWTAGPPVAYADKARQEALARVATALANGPDSAV